jgi:TRAP-type C4-dicarboxylate transport system substrate-binding protein
LKNIIGEGMKNFTKNKPIKSTDHKAGLSDATLTEI